MEKHDLPAEESPLEFEPHDALLRERYRAALRGRLDRHLSGPPRVRYVAVGLAGLAVCLVCGSLAVTEPASTPSSTRGLLALFAFLGLGWILLAARVLARGDGDFVAHRTLAARMAFGCTLASVIAVSLATSLAGRSAVGMPMVATGLALLIAAAVLLIDARIERSESSIREQVLLVEARLGELAGAIERAGGGRDVEG